MTKTDHLVITKHTFSTFNDKPVQNGLERHQTRPVYDIIHYRPEKDPEKGR